VAATKKKKVEVEEIELDEELDEELDLDDLADDEDDDEDEVEDDEDEDEDEDEEVPVKKTKKAAKSKTAAKAKAKVKKGSIGASDLAEALSTDEKTVSGRELRVLLRQKGLDEVAKNENNRYEWPSVEAALEQLGFDDLDEARDALMESRTARLEELKEKVAKGKNAKAKPSTKKKKAPVVEDEDDDEDDDEDEDEVEETPPPRKKKTTKK
jgi:hypothetical protein